MVAALGVIPLVAVHEIVTLALPVFVLSARLAAVTVTVAGFGGVAGAVYTAVVAPFAAIVPTVAFPPAIPFTLHVTPGAGLPLAAIVAEKSCPPPAGTVTDAGVTVTTMSSLIVTVAAALPAESAALTAAIVTAAFDGIVDGAV